MDPAHDDVELGDLENDAFIPGPRNGKKKTNGISARWVPARIRAFFENLSRIKLMLLILIAFILGLVFISYWNGRYVARSVPNQSVALSEEILESLSGTDIPEYVLTYAPLVYLDKGDSYYPSDLATHISKTHPTINFTAVESAPDLVTLDNLNDLNALGGDEIYLTSTEPLIKLPKFLNGDAPDKKTLRSGKGTNCVIAVAEKGRGILDAFYMYFYTFNEGPTALGHRVGNHLGDWEHNMIRFQNGEPQAIWYSQHEYGEAYTYDAVHKIGKRPVGFSAKGSHANYAKSGSHDLHEQDDQIPAHIAYDHTSQGLLWDPTLSAYFYTYSTSTNMFSPALSGTPVNYLYFQGQWGDQEYEDRAEGQEDFHGFHKWTGGPRGPRDKHLDRKDVCLTSSRDCIIKTAM